MGARHSEMLMLSSFGAGFTYERKSIIDWLSLHHTSPMTGEAMSAWRVTRNLQLQNQIHAWQQKRGDQLRSQARSVALASYAVHVRYNGRNLSFAAAPTLFVEALKQAIADNTGPIALDLFELLFKVTNVCHIFLQIVPESFSGCSFRRNCSMISPLSALVVSMRSASSLLRRAPPLCHAKCLLSLFESRQALSALSVCPLRTLTRA
jgi:hypothetical protein